MASVNKVIIVGNLGADPELKTFDNGGKIANISVATTDRWTDRNTGEQREATEWHRITFNDRLAEIVAQYLRKGSSVYVEGSLKTRKWQDPQTGQDRYTTEIRATSMQMLGSRQGGNDGYQNQNYQNQSNQGFGGNGGYQNNSRFNNNNNYPQNNAGNQNGYQNQNYQNQHPQNNYNTNPMNAGMANAGAMDTSPMNNGAMNTGAMNAEMPQNSMPNSIPAQTTQMPNNNFGGQGNAFGSPNTARNQNTQAQTAGNTAPADDDMPF